MQQANHSTASKAVARSRRRTTTIDQAPWRRPAPEMGPADDTGSLVDWIDTSRALILAGAGLVWPTAPHYRPSRDAVMERDMAAAAAALAAQMLPDLPLVQLRWSPASARAVREFRRRTIPLAVRLLEQWLADGRLQYVTIILTGWWFPIGELHQADAAWIARQFRQRLLYQIRRTPGARMGMFIGMFEVSVTYLKDSDGSDPTGYQVHIHAVCDAAMLRAVNKLNEGGFMAGPRYVRVPILPYEVLTLERLQSKLGYCLKGQPRRPDFTGTISKTTGESGPAWQHELAADLVVEPLLWLDRWTFTDLTVVIGTYDLRGALKGRWPSVKYAGKSITTPPANSLTSLTNSLPCNGVNLYSRPSVSSGRCFDILTFDFEYSNHKCRDSALLICRTHLSARELPSATLSYTPPQFRGAQPPHRIHNQVLQLGPRGLRAVQPDRAGVRRPVHARTRRRDEAQRVLHRLGRSRYAGKFQHSVEVAARAVELHLVEPRRCGTNAALAGIAN